MASPKMLALRASLAGLNPRPLFVNRPGPRAYSRPGEFADLTARSGAQAKRARRERQAIVRKRGEIVRGFERTIPVGGPGRRRAKNQRNAKAVEATEAERQSLPTAVTARTRGRTYEDDSITPSDDAFGGLRQPELGERFGEQVAAQNVGDFWRDADEATA